MMSLLIVGGSADERVERVKEIIAKKVVDIVDVFNLIPEKTIGIDQIRDFRKWLNITPFKSKIKIGVINKADALTYEAASALLKILEEPPKSSLIILEAENIDSLLPTVISRCKILEFKIKKKKRKYKENILFNDLVILMFGDAGEKFTLAQKVSQDKENIKSWIYELGFLIREIILCHYKKKESLFTNKLMILAGKNKLSQERLILALCDLIKKLQIVAELSGKNINLRLLLENFVLNIEVK